MSFNQKQQHLNNLKLIKNIMLSISFLTNRYLTRLVSYTVFMVINQESSDFLDQSSHKIMNMYKISKYFFDFSFFSS